MICICARSAKSGLDIFAFSPWTFTIIYPLLAGLVLFRLNYYYVIRNKLHLLRNKCFIAKPFFQQKSSMYVNFCFSIIFWTTPTPRMSVFVFVVLSCDCVSCCNNIWATVIEHSCCVLHFYFVTSYGYIVYTHKTCLLYTSRHVLLLRNLCCCSLH